jgi:hypothetical protein
MDVVRQETRTDAAVAAYGVSGKGVMIAILDRGIDWKHPDFRKPNGTTRIKWLIDMTGQTWCNAPNQPYQEYSEAQINDALSGGPTIPSRDAVGHGTVTAGLAAGDGSAAAGGKYRGMAPEADLIIIKMTSDGAPAHGNQPAEAPFVACIDDALEILDAKLAELGEPPVVALINSGTQWGPIDGTSAVSRKIDEVFGTDRPGRVYVSASGDEAWHDNHAGGDYDDSGATVVRFFKSAPSGTYMQMWYSGSQPAQVTVHFDSGQTATVLPEQFVSNAGIQLSQLPPGQEFYPWTSTSGDRAIWMYTQGPSGGGEIRVTGLQPGTGHFDIHGDFFGVFTFDDHVVPGRLNDYSATLSAIVAGAHVSRTSWTDVNGIPRQNTSEGSTHELWAGSSAGPTRDGRPYGVDLSAPGHNAFAAYAPDSYWATFTGNLIQDGAGWYGRAGATSGSAPLIVGAVALMLERNPCLTGAQVRRILRDTARVDGFTESVPNLDWGYGKLDVLAALDSTPGATPGAHEWCNGFDDDCDGSVDEGCGSDFDGNGTLDVLWRSTTTGQTGAWLLEDASVVDWCWMPTEPAGSGWQIQGTGDFDGDGGPDVLWRSTVTGQVGAWLLDGCNVTGWCWMPAEPVDSGWQIQSVADFDGDGGPDVLWRNPTSGQTGAWLMNGCSVAGWCWMPTEPPDSGWRIQGAGGFDSNGSPDVLWRNAITGEVGAWLMDGCDVTGWCWMPAEPVGSGWQIQGVGDFDGDGDPDVLWRSTITGEVGAWLMDGCEVVGWAWMPTEPPDSGWQIEGP